MDVLSRLCEQDASPLSPWGGTYEEYWPSTCGSLLASRDVYVQLKTVFVRVVDTAGDLGAPRRLWTNALQVCMLGGYLMRLE